MTKKVFYVTQNGLKKLQQQFETYQKNKQIILEDLVAARGQGDLSENSEYTTARQALEHVQAQLDETERIVNNAEVIAEGSGGKQIIVGSFVKLQLENGEYRELQIVGTVEADPLNGKISDESPLGVVLLGKAKAEKVSLRIGRETMHYTIVSIT